VLTAGADPVAWSHEWLAAAAAEVSSTLLMELRLRVVVRLDLLVARIVTSSSSTMRESSST
jgi:hypothetical protein